MNLKRKAILSILLVGAFLSLQAQTAHEKRWRFGLKAGVNISNISEIDDSYVDYQIKPLVGYHLGILSEYKLTSRFYFTPSINLSIKGMRLSAEMGGDSIPVITPIDTTYTITDQTKIKEHRKLAYLEIPILFSYHIPCSPQCHIGLSVGPYFGFGLFGKYTIEDTRFPDIEQGRGDVFSKNMYSTRLDVGIMAGAHIELYKHYRLGVNYAQGLTSLQESIGPQEIKPKNRTWSVSVGYIF